MLHPHCKNVSGSPYQREGRDIVLDEIQCLRLVGYPELGGQRVVYELPPRTGVREKSFDRDLIFGKKREDGQEDTARRNEVYDMTRKEYGIRRTV